MQPDHEADDLRALLDEEYGAPRLEDQFSADLIERLQAEAAPLSTPTKACSLSLSICRGAVAVAALVIAIIWISNLGVPATNHKMALRANPDSELASLVLESEVTRERVINEGIEKFSALSEVENLSEVPRDRRESEAFRRAEQLSQITEQLSLVPNHRKQRRNISAMVARADMLYVVDRGQLYEVSPIDGSRRTVGDDDWKNTAAMGAASGHLYIVSDRQLYEVNPATGARRSLGKPDWVKTEAIVTIGDKLYIVGDDLLYRVNPNEGSQQVLYQKSGSTKDLRKPKKNNN